MMQINKIGYNLPMQLVSGKSHGLSILSRSGAQGGVEKRKLLVLCEVLLA